MRVVSAGGIFALLALLSPLYGQGERVSQIREIYARAGKMIAAGELQQYRVALESVVPGAGERSTLVHFYYSPYWGADEDGGHALAKITLRHSLAASTDVYGEYLFDEAGETVFYYGKADGAPCRETRFYLAGRRPAKIKINPPEGGCRGGVDGQAPAYERTAGFSDEDRANAARLVAKAAEYREVFARLTRLADRPEAAFALAGPEGAADTTPVFSSVHTEFLGPGCRDVEELSDHGDTPQVCEGVEGYQLYVYYNHYGHELLRLQATDNDFEIPLAAEGCDDTQLYSAKIEWRTAAGRPFAVIAQTACHYLVLAEEDGLEYEAFEAGDSYILVKGLAGFEHIDHEIELKDDTTVDRARKLADTGYASPR